MEIIRDSKGRICKGSIPWIKGKKGLFHPKSEWKIGQLEGKKHPLWKGGRYKTKDGYINVLCKDHPRTVNKSKKYIFEHILVVEDKLGRYLTSEEQVHHINGIKDDNRKENLVVISSSEHSIKHAKQQNNRIGINKDKPSYMVGQFSLTGELINTFISLQDSSNKTGIDKRLIHGCITGRNKNTKGYIWKKI